MLSGTCAITGKPLQPGDVVLTIGGERYGVKAGVWNKMTPQEQHAFREELERGTRAALETVTAAEPVYEAMSDDDLTALMKERGLDLTGRRGKSAKIDALRMNDVRARFAEEVTESAVETPESEG